MKFVCAARVRPLFFNPAMTVYRDILMPPLKTMVTRHVYSFVVVVFVVIIVIIEYADCNLMSRSFAFSSRQPSEVTIGPLPSLVRSIKLE